MPHVEEPPGTTIRIGQKAASARDLRGVLLKPARIGSSQLPSPKTQKYRLSLNQIQLDTSNARTPLQTPYYQSTQIKRSPSFRLKNHSSENANKRPSISRSTNQDRINRINVLGSLIEQIENDKAPQKSLASELATVPKTKIDHYDPEGSNIEELHFYLVQQQQHTKRVASQLEEKYCGAI